MNRCSSAFAFTFEPKTCILTVQLPCPENGIAVRRKTALTPVPTNPSTRFGALKSRDLHS